jgi:hypothetical protein
MIDKKPQHRREFLNTGARVLGLMGLGAYGVQQVTKGHRLADDPNCIKLDTCSYCVEFGGCEKPKAENHRHEFGKEGA